ncbi:type II toxin-antitoxin system RelE/ParE family toxin [Nitratifractor sp.]|uniref:type II toxin-antitoxin system RelE/ParE family toxin n=1 Tax=Nitratifractor sp. TaxID=2268144 RepID=UPI0025D138C5|nr:type II toxin-antitoxin system RelE/ParE family toxin [Nitratifractor sp.]
MNFKFHPEVEAELNAAIDYYEERQENLGLEFAQEVYAAIHRIIGFPEAWQRMTETTRRCLTNRFPFSIVYTLKDGTIVIVAVMHLNREPGYWKKRR